MKKKNKKFKDLDINIENKPKKPLEIVKTLKISSANNIIRLKNISYFIISQNKFEENSTFPFFSIINKENLELIQKIHTNIYNQCLIINENSILLSKMIEPSTDLWTKDKSNKFIKTKSLSIIINSNFLFNSNSNLLFHYFYPNSSKSEIQIWKTKDEIPEKLISKYPTITSYIKKLFFLKNETILVIYHYESDDIGISFYNTNKFNIIKNIELDNKYCDLKPFKFDENRIIIIEKISDDCSYDDNIIQKIKIMKIPEFEIVKEIEAIYECRGVLTYKEFFILYEPSIIRVYNNDNYQLFKEIDIRGIFTLSKLKDNYLIGLVNQYANFDKYYEYDEKEKTQIRDLILYKVNF